MKIFSGFVSALTLALLVGLGLWIILEEKDGGIHITDDIGLLE